MNTENGEEYCETKERLHLTVSKKEKGFRKNNGEQCGFQTLTFSYIFPTQHLGIEATKTGD